MALQYLGMETRAVCPITNSLQYTEQMRQMTRHHNQRTTASNQINKHYETDRKPKHSPQRLGIQCFNILFPDRRIALKKELFKEQNVKQFLLNLETFF